MSRTPTLSKITKAKLAEMEEKSLQELFLRILKRTEGVEKAELWHGPQECGVDIYFAALDVVSGISHFGVQVKRGDIKKSRSKISKDLKVILAQILMAYSRKFPDLLSPQNDVKLSGFYLVCNGVISPEARETIKEISNYCQNLHFVDGEGLWQLILATRSGNVSKEVRNVR